MFKERVVGYIVVQADSSEKDREIVYGGCSLNKRERKVSTKEVLFSDNNSNVF